MTEINVEFYSKNKLEKLVRLFGFIVWIKFILYLYHIMCILRAYYEMGLETLLL